MKRGELALFAPITTDATMSRHVVVNHAAAKRVNILINRRHWHSVQNRANRFCLAARGATLWLFCQFEHIQSMEQGCSTVRDRRFYETRTRSYLFMEARTGCN